MTPQSAFRPAGGGPGPVSENWHGMPPQRMASPPQCSSGPGTGAADSSASPQRRGEAVGGISFKGAAQLTPQKQPARADGVCASDAAASGVCAATASPGGSSPAALGLSTEALSTALLRGAAAQQAGGSSNCEDAPGVGARVAGAGTGATAHYGDASPWPQAAAVPLASGLGAAANAKAEAGLLALMAPSLDAQRIASAQDELLLRQVSQHPSLVGPAHRPGTDVATEGDSAGGRRVRWVGGGAEAVRAEAVGGAEQQHADVQPSCALCRVQ